MYGQGTSSMEYPIKNIRIKWNDGTKFQLFKNSEYPDAKIICLKADFMESSGSHNTGTANLINSLLIDMKY
jgi:hypothetical protein